MQEQKVRSTSTEDPYFKAIQQSLGNTELRRSQRLCQSVAILCKKQLDELHKVESGQLSETAKTELIKFYEATADLTTVLSAQPPICDRVNLIIVQILAFAALQDLENLSQVELIVRTLIKAGTKNSNRSNS